MRLQPQHHHDVGVAQALAHVAADLDAEILDAGRQQGRGATTDPRAQRVEQDDVERATRECMMSPQIAMVSASIGPLLRRMVSASSSAWSGAGTVAGIDHGAVDPARSSTAPEAWWRTTSMSGCMAFSVIAVSISVSPLRIEDDETDMFMTSALRACRPIRTRTGCGSRPRRTG
jgi:hypothetical protein